MTSTVGTDLERVLLTTMQQVLALPDLGPEESFFSAGGTSLHAEVFARTASEAIGEPITFTDVFQFPSPAALAAAILQRGSRVQGTSVARALTDSSKWHPVSENQWARLDRLARGQTNGEPLTRSTVELVGVGIELRGHLDVTALAAAVEEVVAATPALRTQFDLAAEPPQQRSVPPSYGLDLFDARGLDASAIVDAVWRPFDLTEGRLARFVLAERDADAYQLWIVIEHIVSDAVSWELVARRLGTAYARRVLRMPSPDADRGRQPRSADVDFAELESELCVDAAGRAAEAHWHAQIQGGPVWRAFRHPSLAEAYPDARAEDVLMLRTAPRQTGRRIAAAAARYGTTVHALTVFSLARAAAEVTGDRDVTVYWYTANRNLPGVAEVVGSLASITMSRIRSVPEGRSIPEVQEVTQIVAGSMANAFYPIDRIARLDHPDDRVQPDDRALLVLHVNPEPPTATATARPPLQLAGVRARTVPFVGRREPRGYTVDASTRFTDDAFAVGVAYREGMMPASDARVLLDAFAEELFAFAEEAPSPTPDSEEPR